MYQGGEQDMWSHSKNEQQTVHPLLPALLTPWQAGFMHASLSSAAIHTGI